MRRSMRIRLVQSLQLLALPADEQIASLPSFVHIPDELALIYENAFEVVRQFPDDLAIELLLVLDAIDLQTSFMTDLYQDGDLDVWTHDAIRHHKAWQIVRLLARTALMLMDEPVDKPSLDWMTYIPGE